MYIFIFCKIHFTVAINYTSEDLKPPPAGGAMVQTVTGSLVEVLNGVPFEFCNGEIFRYCLSKNKIRIIIYVYIFG